MSISAQLGGAHIQHVGDAKIAYRECGRGRPLVFVHGILVNGDLWRDVVPSLAGDYRCIAPDWPLGSHADAMPRSADMRPPAVARLVSSFITSLQLRDVVLIGSDTGGAIVQLIVAQNPAWLGAVVLTNCDAYENFFPPAIRSLTYLARVPGFVDALAFVLRARLARRALCATVAHRTPSPEILASYFSSICADPGVRRDVRNALASVAPRYTLEAAKAFASFEKPVGIAWGEDDPLFFPMRFAERLERAFPRATLLRIARSRTLVPEDRPQELAAFISSVARA